MAEQKHIIKKGRDFVLPEGPLCRERASENVIKTLRPLLKDKSPENLHIHGKEGAGKSYLISSITSRLQNQDSDMFVSKIDCLIHDTEYKILRKITNHLGGEIPKSGYSLSLARETFKDLLSERENLIILLKNVEMLLERDEDKLFYFLSRMGGERDLPEFSVVTTSSKVEELGKELTSRTRSSYNFRKIRLRELKTKEALKILNNYFDNFGLEKRVIRKAISLSRTENDAETINLRLAFGTLKELIGKFEKPFDEETVESAYNFFRQKRYNFLKAALSKHERLLLKAVRRVSQKNKKIWSGATYEAYRKLCEENDIEPHSERILGNYMTKLSLLGFVDIDRYEGGSKGKTRRIIPKSIAFQ